MFISTHEVHLYPFLSNKNVVSQVPINYRNVMEFTVQHDEIEIYSFDEDVQQPQIFVLMFNQMC